MAYSISRPRVWWIIIHVMFGSAVMLISSYLEEIIERNQRNINHSSFTFCNGTNTSPIWRVKNVFIHIWSRNWMYSWIVLIFGLEGTSNVSVVWFEYYLCKQLGTTTRIPKWSNVKVMLKLFGNDFYLENRKEFLRSIQCVLWKWFLIFSQCIQMANQRQIPFPYKTLMSKSQFKCRYLPPIFHLPL